MLSTKDNKTYKGIYDFKNSNTNQLYKSLEHTSYKDKLHKTLNQNQKKNN